MRNITLSILAVLVFTACGEGEKHDPPQNINWDPECEGTLDANACVTLEVSSTQNIRASAPGDVIGMMFWALYKEGDVDPMAGPVAGAVAVVSGEIASVDLSADGYSHLVHVTNVAPQKYHPLLQLDDDASGGPNDGDVVTLPKPAFDAPAGEHTSRNVSFDFLCVGGACDP